MTTNNSGGMYNDTQMQHVRPEHAYRIRRPYDFSPSCEEEKEDMGGLKCPTWYQGKARP